MGDEGTTLAGRRVLITGAARGIGAATARRLHERGARVVLAGLEPDELASVAADCGDAAWWECDVSDRERVEAVVAEAVDGLGGLDVVMANAGIASQLPMLGGDPGLFDKTVAVNLTGTYNTLRAAGPHIAHPRGYALAVASLAAAVHPPLMAPYNASKAGVEALGDTLRIELRPSGARVGVAYFAELDTDMTSRGFSTRAAHSLLRARPGNHVAPLEPAIDAIERGIARRSRRVVSPSWVRAVLPIRELAHRAVEVAVRRTAPKAIEIALEETDVELTTPQPR
jgi:NAD(P)-dependent dehydrogenase (short-subunit alcohol dehydrogenase family)